MFDAGPGLCESCNGITSGPVLGTAPGVVLAAGYNGTLVALGAAPAVSQRGSGERVRIVSMHTE
jgi:hypothetical protein